MTYIERRPGSGLPAVSEPEVSDEYGTNYYEDFFGLGDDISYDYFHVKAERDDVIEASQKAVAYAEENDVAAFVFVDSSARPFWKGIKDYWKYSHDKSQPAPAMYFINPDAFRSRRRGAPLEIPESRFAMEHPFLFGHKDKTVALVDTCIHTGESVRPIMFTMMMAGFVDVRLVVVGDEHNKSGAEPDLTLLSYPERGCYPFNSVMSTAHVGERLYSVRCPSVEQARRTAAVREEIGRIIKSHFEPKADAPSGGYRPSYEDY